MVEYLNIVTWKWDTGTYTKKGMKYTSDHVNILKRGVKKNLKIPHQFICITDDSNGLDSDIKVLDIPRKDPPFDYMCYVRLWAFSKEAEEILGPRFVSIDLDAVVVGDLTPLFDRDEPFIIHKGTVRTLPYNGSMWMLKTGVFNKVWDKFNKNVANKIGTDKRGSDQLWFPQILGKDMPTWGPEDGVYVFRHLFRIKRNQTDFSSINTELPSNARIVLFPGNTDPSQKRIRENFPWVRKYWILE